MEASYRSFSEKAHEFVSRIKENPEVNAGLVSLSEGTYGLLSSSGTVIYGIINILKGTIATAAPRNDSPEIPFDFHVKTVRKNPITGDWNLVEAEELV